MSGLTVRVGGAPRQAVDPNAATPAPVARICLLGADYPVGRLEVLVSEGTGVARGTPILRDRARPAIVVTSPVAGVVDEVTMGPRRRLSRLGVRIDGEAAVEFPRPASLTRQSARDAVLAAGLWPAFTARPFGGIPDPDAEPSALFVMAADTRPNAPDPNVVIATDPDAFREGIHLLRHLTDAPIHLCQPPGAATVHSGGHLHAVTVDAPHPAGLAGTQIFRHCPVEGDKTVWQIGYQDVMEIGAIVGTGRRTGTRIVALGGPMARDPRLIRLPEAAELDTLTAAEALPGQRRTLSGALPGGREARWLRRGDTQITILPRPAPLLASRWLPAPRRALRPAPVVPHAALDRALGPDIPAMALIRALSTGDAAAADRLGARALLEEDVALLAWATGGAEDFAALLRGVLDRLEART